MKQCIHLKVLKIFSLAAFIFCIFSCDDDNGNSSDGNKLKTGQIEIKTYPYGSINTIDFEIAAKKATVDWGDGSIDEYTPNGTWTVYKHVYPDRNFRKITINTDGMTGFQTNAWQELRVGKSPELTILAVGYPKGASYVVNLTRTVLEIDNAPSLAVIFCETDYEYGIPSLDVSKCPALTNLYCRGSFTTNELNNLFKSLPTRQKSENAKIGIGGPGSYGCDRTIAEKKGWEFY